MELGIALLCMFCAGAIPLVLCIVHIENEFKEKIK